MRARPTMPDADGSRGRASGEAPPRTEPRSPTTVAGGGGDGGRHGDGGEDGSGRWQFQLRVRLADDLAPTARRDPSALDPAVPGFAPLGAILRRHNATLVCQYDAFADYVAEAERRGTEGFPFHAWTKATIEDPAKKAKYLKAFSLRVDGAEVYSAEKADALERDLRPLVGGPLVVAMSRHDTNPANNPQVPKRYRP